MRPVLRFLALALYALSVGSFAQSIEPLPALNIDITQTSVSGLSSGGFMAGQLAVAFSSIIKGAGIVAAGPFYCSQGSLLTATTRCSCSGEPVLACQVSPASTAVPALVSAARTFFSRGLIDDPANIAGQRVITIAGARDPIVPQAVVQQLDSFYTTLGLPPGNLSAVSLANAGHTMPTVKYGAACDASVSPYIGKCQYDAAQAILGWIYGPTPLKPPGARPAGHFVQFDQTPYLPQRGALSLPGAAGLDSSGWIYIPDDCKAGARCRLHIALHGCEQGQDFVPVSGSANSGLFYGKTFVTHSGYDRWADNNQIVVLFPQAVAIPVTNALGCWDWWGYTDGHFADQKGVQMQAIRAMIKQLASGSASQ